jgi:hypothetical protein
MPQYLPNRQRLWHILYFSQLNQETLYWCKANKYYIIILFVMRIIDVITIGVNFNNANLLSRRLAY